MFMFKDLKLENLTVFKDIHFQFVPGINIFIGQNGTGKTHLLKLLYSTISCLQENRNLGDKLVRVFLPRGLSLSRLVTKGQETATIQLNTQKDYVFKASISIKEDYPLISSGFKNQIGKDFFPEGSPAKPVYIPVKEMLGNAPGFRSLYATREVHFEEIYFDIIDRALLPVLKQESFMESEQAEKVNKSIKEIQKIIGGKVSQKQEEFYLRTGKGEVEFPMLAEGHRKLALLWILIKNGCLSPGSVLFWDEPEANLNPAMMPVIVKTLLALEQTGVQIFIATHNYELLKEFDLQKNKHSLIFNVLHLVNKEVQLSQAEDYVGLDPNIIEEQFTRLYDLEIQRTFGRRNG